MYCYSCQPSTRMYTLRINKMMVLLIRDCSCTSVQAVKDFAKDSIFKLVEDMLVLF